MSCVIKRIYTIKCPVLKSDTVKITISESSDGPSCLWQYSYEMVCWSKDWLSYSDLIDTLPEESFFYLRFITSSINLKIYINGIATQNYTSCLQASSFTESLCNDNISLIDNLECAVNLQNQLADSVICLTGIPIYYYKVEPNVDTKDINFKEYLTHKVDSMKYIKMVSEDGELPSTNPTMVENFDFDFAETWKVEVSKRTFATAFGDTAFPHQRDIVFVPMLNRIFEVNSAYDEKQKGLLGVSSTWILTLIKFAEKDNVNFNDFTGPLMELNDKDISNLNSWSEVFKNEEAESERVTGANQTYLALSQSNTTRLFTGDSIRQEVSNSVSVGDLILNNKSNIVAKNIYVTSTEPGCIVYQKKFCAKTWFISLILKTGESLPAETTQICHCGIDISVKGEKLLIDSTELPVELEANNIYLVWASCNYVKFKCEAGVAKYNQELNVKQKHYFDFDAMEICNFPLSNDWGIEDNAIYLTVQPQIALTNFRYFASVPADNAELLQRNTKYIITDKSCVINDNARQIKTGLGFSIK